MTVEKWSGRETRALREAKRMSLREFAAHLGVSDRTVSKWEAGADRIHPRPDSQAMLDTALERASDEVCAHFDLLTERGRPAAPGVPLRDEPRSPVIAPLLPGQSGVGRVHLRTGKWMILVEAGPFLFGPHNSVVDLPSFYLDVTPATNADYARFVVAESYRAPGHWPEGRCPTEIDDHPVVDVTHQDAEAYCLWAGVELPSEEQWEKAARGVHGQFYPWGDQATVAKCNVRESGIGRSTPVERYHSGVSPYGVYDLSGNVWEWCRTETDPGRYVLKGSAFTRPSAWPLAPRPTTLPSTCSTTTPDSVAP